MKCTKCGNDNYLDDEKIHYYREGGLIVNGKLVKCPYCIDHEISFVSSPYIRVIPVPSFTVDAMFSPLNMNIIVTIKPVTKEL